MFSLTTVGESLSHYHNHYHFKYQYGLLLCSVIHVAFSGAAVCWMVCFLHVLVIKLKKKQEQTTLKWFELYFRKIPFGT